MDSDTHIAMAGTRKGGLKKTTQTERAVMESLGVIWWGYVAPLTELSMRSLKLDALVDQACSVCNSMEPSEGK